MTTQVPTAAKTIDSYCDANRIEISDPQCESMASVMLSAISTANANRADPVAAGASAAMTYAAENRIALTDPQATAMTQEVIAAPDDPNARP
jgi:hypothetical protein